MPTFGPYESHESLRPSVAAQILRATARDGTNGRFVIKALRVRAGMDPAAIDARAVDFLAAADVQRRAAEAASPSENAWAPIYDAGRSDEGVPYYVTSYYPRSVDSLLRTNTRLNDSGMRTLAIAIAHGLKQLDTACQRSHGNLKPTNILLAGDIGVENQSIVLTDPEDPASLAAGGGFDDLTQLGKILFQLATGHAPRSGAAEFESPTAAEDWRIAGPYWRSLVRRLVDPTGDPAPLTLQSLLSELSTPHRAAVATGGKSRLKPILAILAVLILAGGGAAVYFLRPHPPVQSLPEDPHQLWTKFVKDYDFVHLYAKTDLGLKGVPFLPDANRFGDRRPSWFFTDEGWKKASNNPLDHYPDRAFDIAELRKAAARVSEAAAKLNGWNVFANLTINANRLEQELCWKKAAEELKRLHNELANPTEETLRDTVEKAENIDSTMAKDILPAMDRLKSTTQLVQSDATQLVEDARRNIIAPADPGAQIEQSSTIVITSICDVFQIVFKGTHFTKEEIAYLGNSLPSESQAWKNTILARYAEVQRFRSSPNPWDAMEKSVNDFAKTYARIGQTGDPALAGEMRDDRTVLDNIRLALDQGKKQHPWQLDKQQSVAEDINAIQSQIDRSQLKKLEDLIARVDSGNVNYRNRKDLLTINRPLPDDLVSEKLVTARKQRMKEIHDGASDLPDIDKQAKKSDEMFVRWERELSPIAVTSDPTNPEASKAANAYLADRRESALDDLIKTGDLASAKKSLATHREGVASLLKDWSDAGALIRAGLPADTELPSHKTLESLLKTDTPSPGLTTALKHQHDDAEKLVRFQPSLDVKKPDLAIILPKLTPAQKITAFLTVQSLASRDDLKATFDFVRDFKSAANPSERWLTDARLRKVAQVSDRAAKLWQSFADSAAKADMELVDSTQSFLAPAMENWTPRGTFNLLLYRSQKFTTDIRPEAFIHFIQSRSDSPCIEAASILKPLLNPKQGETQHANPTTLAGPTAGSEHGRWTLIQPSSAANKNLVYEYRPANPKSSTYILTFVLLALDKNRAVYLSQTEIPFGLFADVIADQKKWDEVDLRLNCKEPQDRDEFSNAKFSKSGPRVWGFTSSGSMEKAPSWIKKELANYFASPPFPSGPSPQSPMQYLNATTAEYFAELVGCRLPTEAEWQRAAAAPPLSHYQPNLRDPTWNSQDNNLQNVLADVGKILYTLTDGDSFSLESKAKVLAPTPMKPANDGVLFFRDVPSTTNPEPGFYDLRGNVAEFVLRTGSADAGSLYSSVKPTNLEKIPVGVIGGSALSDPALQTDVALPLSFAYSDVGFRLAFPGSLEEPTPTWAELLAKVKEWPGN